MKKRALSSLCGLFFLALSIQGQVNLLHEFAGGAADGKAPWSDPVISGSTLYGMTNRGGDRDLGTIFKMQSDGSGFTLLHKFAGYPSDGSLPEGSLIRSNSTLYGMTNLGGRTDEGSIFKVQTDGTGYTVLRSFAGGPADGKYPGGSLLLAGSTLFGMTRFGGSHDAGTIFRVEIDGSGFTLLHSFTDTLYMGTMPSGNLILSGSTLYGMTTSGGPGARGTIFKIQPDGSGYVLLHEFAGGADDGEHPNGSLLLSGSTLFGMTAGGGDGLYGTVFKLQTDGSGYALLYEFAGGAVDGKYPKGDLVLCDSTLFGMTLSGGNKDSGTIFRIGTDGAGYTILHEFSGGDGDGKFPYGSLVLSGSALLGMTSQGGDRDGGVIFSLPRLNVNITILAERHVLRTFSIERHYARIRFAVENPDTPAPYYCVKRRKGSGDFILLKTIEPAELKNNQFQMRDKYLEKGTNYTYRVEAYNASGQLIGISAEKTI